MVVRFYLNVKAVMKFITCCNPNQHRQNFLDLVYSRNILEIIIRFNGKLPINHKEFNYDNVVLKSNKSLRAQT